MIVAFSTIVLAVIGSATYLASSGAVSGSTTAEMLVLILASVGATGAVHVTGQVIKTTNGHTDPQPGQSVTVTRVDHSEPVTATGPAIPPTGATAAPPPEARLFPPPPPREP